ncbi:cytochrome c biogenesis protein CcdA [Flavitalea sp. BT771]|uniref:protein-disulfide reductase DsbD family protein n=1 Tax=Flavitalea sp. BT771 TaxID=3063329 RepID=UPI0026E19666|nr:cytochrome c biogenesis protein CcdA [Flavitalea sp. BT771]MDO6428958.1 cytochrome c biogenesis protein CcdA [Flavitalea sp. BT771]MDV6218914.1 cytochrome c biogenesis protein CcdA [Flavitalea sp. BT771]
MRYRFLLFVLFSVVLQVARAQDTSAIVKWEFSAVKDGGVSTLVLHGKIKDGWHLYSTTMKDDLPNSRVTLDSAARAAIDKIEEKGQLDVRKEPLFENAETRSFEKDVQLLVHLKPGASDLKGMVTYMAIYKDSVVGPVEVPFRYVATASGELVAKSTDLQESTAGANDLKKGSIKLDNPVNKCGGTEADDSKSKSLLGIFVIGFLGGLVGLIMPCTFPMIPLTVSFFTKRSASRKKGVANAFLYGFFIFIIYVLISVPFYFLKANNANILNDISTNIWLNIIFAVIFLAFALSFFGLFEITLPSSISNSVDSKSNMSSLGGIFFMALTLAIVSFSCTGPILGTLLVGALGQQGGAVQLTFAMAGFGLALGLPFALFALFPNWLQSLPRSGGWMNTVKIVFGFVELALALKYLSNADLVSHWGLVRRETFFGIWIVIDFALVLYLLGVIKFKHDPPPAQLSKSRIGIAILFLAFGLYLVPGLTNTRYANLSLVSGFPPPLSYSLYKHNPSDGKGVEALVINDYDKALEMAKAQHKPILIDFTGWACVNCRRMEENVWPQTGVKDLIKNDYILVSLYVDDKKQLPEDQQFLFTTSDGSKKKIVTIGDKFATLQSENFRKSSQPLYVVISPDEKLLNVPVGYTPSVKEYAEWLQCGLDAFHKN